MFLDRPGAAETASPCILRLVLRLGFYGLSSNVWRRQDPSPPRFRFKRPSPVRFTAHKRLRSFSGFAVGNHATLCLVQDRFELSLLL